jgi:hypothetical protein
MPHNVKTFRVVLASPNDVKQERQAFANLVNTVNTDTARPVGCHLELWQWETDTHPGFHLLGPQGIVDANLRIQDCDLFVGILWNRFGTPTADGKTGTEHEFRIAYESWATSQRPEIMFYFNQMPSTLTLDSELDQRRGVLAFRKGFPSTGMYCDYRGRAEFAKHVGRHLRQFLHQSHQAEPATDAQVQGGVRTEVETFTLPIRPRGLTKIPMTMLRLLGLSEGDSLNFGIANGQIESVNSVKSPRFTSSQIDLMRQRMESSSVRLTPSEIQRLRGRRGSR